MWSRLCSGILALDFAGGGDRSTVCDQTRDIRLPLRHRTLYAHVNIGTDTLGRLNVAGRWVQGHTRAGGGPGATRRVGRELSPRTSRCAKPRCCGLEPSEISDFEFHGCWIVYGDITDEDEMEEDMSLSEDGDDDDDDDDGQSRWT